MRQLLIFEIANRKFGLDINHVERVTRAAWITPIPHGPAAVAGALNIQGEILPVLDLKKRWRLDEENSSEVSLSDQFIIARAGARDLVLWVEKVHGVRDCADEEWVNWQDVIESAPETRGEFLGALKWEGEIVLVCNASSLLAPEEVSLLDSALNST